MTLEDIDYSVPATTDWQIPQAVQRLLFDVDLLTIGGLYRFT